MCYDAAGSIFARFTSFYFVEPQAEDLLRYAANETTPEETDFIARFIAFSANDAGYIAIQDRKPLVLAGAMTDRFIEWVAWNAEYRYHASGAFEWTPEQILTQSTVLFIQGTHGTFRAYKTWAAGGALNDTAYPSPNIPTDLMHPQSGDWGREGVICNMR